MNKQALDYNIKCQKKGCRQRICWKLSSPTWNKTKDDILPKPIGFCTSIHLLEWLQKEFSQTVAHEIVRKTFTQESQS